MTRRYFVPALPLQGGLVELPHDEAAHACRVMRIQPGETLVLFDGLGNEASATVDSVGRNQCLCEASLRLPVDREPATHLHLAIALPKPDRAKEMIERLTELGVGRVTPLVAERTQRAPSESLIGKLQRAVIEACKQSGRNVLMVIDPPQPAADFFISPREGIRLIAHQGTPNFSVRSLSSAPSLTCAIGPEGGWTDQEVSLAQENGFQSIDLGKRIYRIETAAATIAALTAIPMESTLDADR